MPRTPINSQPRWGTGLLRDLIPACVSRHWALLWNALGVLEDFGDGQWERAVFEGMSDLEERLSDLLPIVLAGGDVKERIACSGG